MKAFVVGTILGILVIILACIIDGFSGKSVYIYDKVCVNKGLMSEIESAKICGKGSSLTKCFRFNHNDCIIRSDIKPDIILMYFCGFIITIMCGFAYGLLYYIEGERRHKENLKSIKIAI
jgi:hypothetical protein